MIRRPPRSTPLSLHDALPIYWRTRPAEMSTTAATAKPSRAMSTAVARSAIRSEEHTSELQSHVNLVCRLLLEKKKKKIQIVQANKKEKVRQGLYIASSGNTDK